MKSLINKIKKLKQLGDKPYFYNINDIEGLDVDNPIDFDVTEYFYKKNF